MVEFKITGSTAAEALDDLHTLSAAIKTETTTPVPAPAPVNPTPAPMLRTPAPVQSTPQQTPQTVPATPIPTGAPMNTAYQVAPTAQAPANPTQAMPVGTMAQGALPATPSSAPTAMPVNAPTPTVQPPVAPAPTYTHEQVGKAGADLVAANQAMMPTLMALLQRYGVQLVTDLKPEQLGPFATELRGLGGKI